MYAPQTSSRHHRRRFLRRTGGAVLASVAAPTFLPRLYAGIPANNRRTLAAIGVGGRGTEIGMQAASLGQMVACCDVHRNNAGSFASLLSKKLNQQCKIYTDYRELLAEEPDIDAVTIGTPDHWHVKIAIAALKAGKHVYCEKPLTLTFEEGQLIQDATAKYGKTFQVGTQQRSEYGMQFLKAVAIAQSGRLGENLTAVSSVGKAGSRSDDPNRPFGPFATAPVPEALDWDLWQGPAQAVEFCPERIGWNFRWWFEYSGGQVTDWGVHHTDIAFWALAGANGQAVEAEGTGEFMGVEREKVLGFLLGDVPATEMPQAYNVAHAFDVNIRLSNGHKIKLVSGTNELLISGERGRLRVNRGSLTGKPVAEVDADPKAQQEIEERVAQLYGGELPHSDRAHMRNFFDCIERGTQPVSNVPHHVRSVNACHLANIALLTSRKVTFDPTHHLFPGDDTANRLMKRTSRAPYAMTV